jgi:hypothetical protein
MPSMASFDPYIYLQLAKSQSPSFALTQLQNDLIQWEWEAFEGQEGYQPDAWKEIQKARELSRFIWEQEATSPKKPS